MVAPLRAVNDFVVKFANINGSGSASANELFARAILRMGVPTSPRNIFPSNIQGLPTWYEVRVSEAGHLGRRGGVDLAVMMNPQTWDQDMAEVEPGGYVFYDSSRPVQASRFRDDVTVLGVPLMRAVNRAYDDPRQRQLFRNIACIGALAQVLQIDRAEIERLLAEQFEGKERLLAGNVRALQLGVELAREHLPAIGLAVRRADAVGDRIFVDGNSAAALGCVYGGATVCAWYPLTPSSSLAEAYESYCGKLRRDPVTGKARYAVIQAEDELAAIGIVVGAGWNGARAFTATSGPGISLMTEFIGLAYFAEIPVTIVNVQRGGPSTGMPTRTQQADLLACAYASHGDTRHVLLFPDDPRECFDMTADALDLADRLQTPVFVMSDLDLGMNRRLCPPFARDPAKGLDRGKVMTAEMLEAGRDFGRYLDEEGDGIPYRSYPGTHPSRGAFFTRGTSRDRYARYSEAGHVYVDNMARLLRKWETARSLVPAAQIREAAVATGVGVIYFGSTAAAMDEALLRLQAQDIHVDALRIRGFPFGEEVGRFIAAHSRVFVIEQNRDAQLRTLLVDDLEVAPAALTPVLHYDGTPITARFISEAIRAALAAVSATAVSQAG